MNGHEEQVATVHLAPGNCISEGWNLVKDQYGLFLGITVVAMLLGSLVPFGIIAGALYCGIFIALFMKMRGEPVEFNTLFKGFDYFLESLLVTLLVIAISVAFMAPMMVVMFVTVAIGASVGDSTDSGALAVAIILPVGLLFFLAMVAFSVFLYGWMFFAYPLLVDRNMQAWPALKLSARAVWANKWGVFGLMLLNWLLSMAGALLCYVGLFLYLPVMFGSFAVAYRRIFPELAPPDAPNA
ncbi:MAG TPA: hypothetical protein PLB67_14135 [Candidatus Hydrogenedentes bacterium]|nr:hypothetical protein [Candidatus Hydrogenedentota bacterium]